MRVAAGEPKRTFMKTYFLVDDQRTVVDNTNQTTQNNYTLSSSCHTCYRLLSAVFLIINVFWSALELSPAVAGESEGVFRLTVA